MTTLTALKPADCHPDRPIRARGLCDKCYRDAYRLERRGGAPPAKTYKTEGRVPGLGELPAIPVDLFVRSHTFTEWPERCPKCHRTTALHREGRELHCLGVWAGCGWTGALVRV